MVFKHWFSTYYFLFSEDGKVKDISSENKTGYEQDKAASVKTPIKPIHISLIGAAQPIAYQFLPLLFNSCFKDTHIAITLHDLEEHKDALEGRLRQQNY